jgi:hypothetical protein
MEFGYGFEKSAELLSLASSSFFRYFIHTKKHEGIALQENSKPFVVVVGIKILEDTGITDMLVWILIHRLKVKFFSS